MAKVLSKEEEKVRFLQSIAESKAENAKVKKAKADAKAKAKAK